MAEQKYSVLIRNDRTSGSEVDISSELTARERLVTTGSEKPVEIAKTADRFSIDILDVTPNEQVTVTINTGDYSGRYKITVELPDLSAGSGENGEPIDNVNVGDNPPDDGNK